MGTGSDKLSSSLLTGTAGLVLAAVTTPAVAQDDGAGSVQTVQRNDVIIVTARKREESLQETPVAVTALTGESLERIYATDLSDLNGQAPNVTVNTIGNFGSSVSVFIRGIGNGDPDSTVDPSVGIYIDGIYIPRTANSSIDMFDVEQVEILRGPQGTLFGRNTTGGAINYRTRRPTGNSDVRGSITLGEYGQRDIRIAAETPIVEDILNFKIAAFSQHLGGYYRNTFTGIPGRRTGTRAGETNVFNLRPMLQFTPTDNFEWTIIGEYVRERSDNLPTINVSTPNQLLQIFYDPPTFGRNEDVREFAWNVPGFSNIDIWGITSEINWEIGPGTLTAVTNYRETEDINNNDTDGTTATIFETLRNQPHEQFSNELRYNWDVSRRLDVIVGAYYFRQEYFLRRDTFLDVRNTGNTTHLNAITGQTHSNFAIFAQADLNLTEELRLSVGGRATWEKKDFFATLFTPFPDLGQQFNLDENWSNFGPRIGLDYQATEDVLLYGHYSRGFKSGGFNGRGGTPGALGPFDEESVDAFEVGLKADWLNNRLRTNLALYYSSYSDLQRTVIRNLPDAANPQETITDNAASADVYGFELEVNAVPVDGLRFDLAVGYNDASYSEFMADLNGDTIVTDNSDLPLSRAPRWTLGTGVSYTADLGSAGALTLRGDWTHVSSQNLLASGAPAGQIPSYNLIDSSIRWDLPGDQFYISAFVKNLGDELYEVSFTPVANLFSFHQISPPQRFGIVFGFDM